MLEITLMLCIIGYILLRNVEKEYYLHALSKDLNKCQTFDAWEQYCYANGFIKSNKPCGDYVIELTDEETGIITYYTR